MDGSTFWLAVDDVATVAWRQGGDGGGAIKTPVELGSKGKNGPRNHREDVFLKCLVSFGCSNSFH